MPRNQTSNTIGLLPANSAGRPELRGYSVTKVGSITGREWSPNIDPPVFDVRAGEYIGDELMWEDLLPDNFVSMGNKESDGYRIAPELRVA